MNITMSLSVWVIVGRALDNVSADGPETMSKRTDIRFDFVGFEENWEESNSYPMGILYITASLKRSGFTNIEYTDHVCLLRKLEDPNNYRIQWMTEERSKNLKNLFEHLKEHQPHIILLGPVTSFHLVELVDLIPKLREQCPEQLILAGGPHFGKDVSLDEELMQRYPELDGIAVGEAEETIVDVAERFYSEFCIGGTVPSQAEFQSKLAEIPGIIVRGKRLKPRNPICLDNLPSPDMELLEKQLKDPWKYMNFPKYRLSNRRNPITWVSRAVVDSDSGSGGTEDDVRYFNQFMSSDYRFPFGVIVGSRGCPYRCSFCCSSGKRRVHSARYIFDQIVSLNRLYGIRLFVFFDPLFTSHSSSEQERVEKLCKKICDSGLDIKCMIDIRPDVILSLPENLLVLMMKSGCVEFNLGLEKGSDRMLLKITKGMTVADHRNAVAKLRRIAGSLGRRVIVNGTFILGGPEETRNDVRKTLIHCFGLHLDQATLYPLEICPGTQISTSALREGILRPGLESYLNPKEYPLFTAGNLSRHYLLYIKRKSEQVLDQKEELKKAMHEIERQFLPVDKQDRFSSFEIKKTKQLHTLIEGCVSKALDYLRKHPEKGLSENGQQELKVEYAKQMVDQEIGLVENELALKYPNYDYHYGDYYPGTLMRNWNHFMKLFEELFSCVR